MNQSFEVLDQSDINAKRRWRILAVLGLLVLVAVALFQARAMPANAVGGCSYVPEVTTNFSCVVRETSFNLLAGQAVVINANVKVDEGGSVGIPPTDKNDPRYLMNISVECFNTRTGKPVWTAGAVRNIWDGIGEVGAYPRGVFVAPSSDTFLCQLHAVQRNLYPDKPSTNAKFEIAESALTVSAPNAHGYSSPGTAKGDGAPSFPPGINDLSAAEPHNPIIIQTVPIGAASTYTFTASVHLSSCSFEWDRGQGYCSSLSTYNDKSFEGTMRMAARQRNATNTAYCGAWFIKNIEFAIGKATHHFTATSTETFKQTETTCTGPLVVKAELLGLDGKGYLGTGNSGESFSHVGVAWN
jgi:hypothetical protein